MNKHTHEHEQTLMAMGIMTEEEIAFLQDFQDQDNLYYDEPEMRTHLHSSMGEEVHGGQMNGILF